MTVCNRLVVTGRVANIRPRFFRPDGSSVTEFSLELDDQEPPSPRSDRTAIDAVAFDSVVGLKPDQLQPGQHLWVEGRLKQRRWKTPEGKLRSRIEVIVTELRRVSEDDGD